MNTVAIFTSELVRSTGLRIWRKTEPRYWSRAHDKLGSSSATWSPRDSLCPPRQRDNYLQQFISSLPSLQSASPSQRHFLWTHSPEPHCISLGIHVTVWIGWRPHCSRDSSDWSEQSASLSHTQLNGMQVPLLHWNSCAPQVGAAQSTSSLPSLQSSFPLQTKLLEMHCPLAQVNSTGLQVTLAKGGKRERLQLRFNK